MKSVIFFVFFFGVIFALDSGNVETSNSGNSIENASSDFIEKTESQNGTETSYDLEAERNFADCISSKVKQNPLNPFMGTGKTAQQTIPFVKAFCWDMMVFRSIVVSCGESTNATDIRDESITGVLRDTATLFRETCRNITAAAENALCMNQEMRKIKRNPDFSCEELDKEFAQVSTAMNDCKMSADLQDVVKRGFEKQKKSLCSDMEKLRRFYF
ncbi:hypothetical protein FO519_006629 [Halicephalobus sp. NKZ332]|nr:hypothetical protein FO519_006629 [Halicephalobus sp. NKZ332]